MKLFLKRAFATIVGVVVALALFIAGYHQFHQSVPYSQLVDPGYWQRHAKGYDNFDPEGAMLFHGNPKLREVALTIDDGPHELYGPRILDVLQQYHVPATFFVVGVRVKQEPDLVRRMVMQGCEVGNHTYDHQRLENLKPHEIANEIRDDDSDIYIATGLHTTVMRPPGVQYNDKVLHVAQALGYVTVNWNNAARDYMHQTPEYIVRHVVDATENGSIILLHQDNPDTAEALPRIISELHRRGYKFITISTMLAHLNIQPYAQIEKAALAKAAGRETVVADSRALYLPPAVTDVASASHSTASHS